jgi:hypothetical protein
LNACSPDSPFSIAAMARAFQRMQIALALGSRIRQSDHKKTVRHLDGEPGQCGPARQLVGFRQYSRYIADAATSKVGQQMERQLDHVARRQRYIEIAFQQQRDFEFAQGNVDVGAYRDLVGLPSELDDFGAMSPSQRIFGRSDRRGLRQRAPHVGPRLGWSQAVQTAYELTERQGPAQRPCVTAAARHGIALPWAKIFIVVGCSRRRPPR